LLYPEHYDHDNALSDKPGATGPMYIERSRDELCAHIARHDPARVLREVAAKRAILARYEERPANLGDSLQQGQECMGLLYAMEALAAVYSDHPDYDPEWSQP
jgi:hypothetical protein